MKQNLICCSKRSKLLLSFEQKTDCVRRRVKRKSGEKNKSAFTFPTKICKIFTVKVKNMLIYSQNVANNQRAGMGSRVLGCRCPAEMFTYS